MGLTFEEAEKLHRELWGWLAETGNKSKCKSPLLVKHKPINGCFACEIVKRDCDACPIDWGTEKLYLKELDEYGFQCENKKSPYWKWFRTYNRFPKARKKYAAIIRDMPWRKK